MHPPVPPSPTNGARCDIFNAALRVLRERGPASVRIRDVAASAVTSTMGVYTHFGSKQGLFDELFVHGFRRLTSQLERVPTTGDRRADLLAFMVAYRSFALRNEALYALMFERAVPGFVPSAESWNAPENTYDLLVERIEGMKEGVADSKREAYVLWCTAHGLVSIELRYRHWHGGVLKTVVSPRAVFLEAIDTVLAGLEASTPPRKRARAK